MKRNRNKLYEVVAILIMLFAILWSAGMSGDSVYATTPTLTLRYGSWNPDASIRSAIIPVTSTGTWDIPTSNQSWLTVTDITPANRTGDGSFRINTTVNTTGAERTGTITVTQGTITRTVTVRQAATIFYLRYGTWSPDASTRGVTIPVTSTGTWNTPTSNQSWLTVTNITPANRTGDGSFRINTTANTTGAERTGTITVTQGTITRTVTVRQAAPVFYLRYGTWSPNAFARSAIIPVTSTGTWNTPTSNQSWLTVTDITPANRTGDGSFRINTTANTTGAERVGTITATQGTITRTVTVRQAAPVLYLRYGSWNPDASIRSAIIPVTSTGTWDIPTSNQSWLTVTDITPTNRTGDGSFRINTTVNTTGAERVGTITVTQGTITRTVTVRQAATVFHLRYSSWSPDATTRNATIPVTSSGTWSTPTSNQSWLTVTNITPANRTGDGSFRINTTANTTGAERTGTITVTQGTITRTVTVRQAAPVFYLRYGTWSPNAFARSAIIPVTSTGTWNTPTSNQSWLTVTDITPANRTGDGSFRINTTANTTGAERVGTITATQGTITRTVTVRQAAPIFYLRYGSWRPDASTRSAIIPVTSTGTWNTPTSNQSWLTVTDITPANRTGDGSFRMNTTANTTGVERTGRITVTQGSIERTVTVTQRATTDITVSWNANGGSVSPASRVHTSGTQLGTLPTPTRTNRVFIGWFTTSAQTGGVRVHPTTIVPTTNVTYFARWHDPNRHDIWTPPTPPQTRISFRFINDALTNQWIGQARRGMNYWNQAAVPVTFYENANAPRTATVRTYQGASLGSIRRRPPGVDITNPAQHGPHVRSDWQIFLNHNNIATHVNANSGFNIGNVMASIMTHELGHAIGLRDNPPITTYNNQSIMNTSERSRNRNVIFRPTPFDIVSVNILYN